MAELGAEEPDERLLVFEESLPQTGPPWRDPQRAKAAPGGAVRLCGEPGLEEEEEEGEEDSEDSGPEGDGEDEPLLRASGTGRGRRACAAWDKEPRAPAGTARGRRLLRWTWLDAEESCGGCAAWGRLALPGVAVRVPPLPARREKYLKRPKCAFCAMPGVFLSCP